MCSCVMGVVGFLMCRDNPFEEGCRHSPASQTYPQTLKNSSTLNWRRRSASREETDSRRQQKDITQFSQSLLLTRAHTLYGQQSADKSVCHCETIWDFLCRWSFQKSFNLAAGIYSQSPIRVFLSWGWPAFSPLSTGWWGQDCIHHGCSITYSNGTFETRRWRLALKSELLIRRQMQFI